MCKICGAPAGDADSHLRWYGHTPITFAPAVLVVPVVPTGAHLLTVL